MIDRLLAEHHILVCTGPGGVGKTTTAAALALRAAESGRRAIVCTIDPARRLAQSLGMEGELGHDPRVVAVRGRGDLSAMMLDMKRTFDELVLDLTTRERADAIFANPFYQHLSSTLAGTQEYMAMQKLWELHEEGRWETIVIDTPPSRRALDLLDAPRRLTDFLEGRLLRLMLWPYIAAGKSGVRVFSFGTKAVLKTLTRITGSDLLADIAEFFRAFEGLYGDFKARSVRVRELLGARRTAFVVVASPTESALREARFFTRRLRVEGMPLGAVIVNRAHRVPATPGLEDPRALAEEVPQGALRASLETFAAWRELSVREDALVAAALGDLGDVPVRHVPDLPDEVADLPSLRTIGSLLAAPP